MPYKPLSDADWRALTNTIGALDDAVFELRRQADELAAQVATLRSKNRAIDKSLADWDAAFIAAQSGANTLQTVLEAMTAGLHVQ